MGFLFGSRNTASISSPAIATMRIQTAIQGNVIPVVFGTNRISPDLFYYNDFTAISNKQSSGGKGLFGGGGASSTTYTYTATVMLGLCEGVIHGIGKTWINKDNLTTLPSAFSLFLGSLTQIAWSFLTTNHPSDALTYRELAYVASANYSLGSNAGLENHSFEILGLARTLEIGGYGIGTPDSLPNDILYKMLSNTEWGLGLTSILTVDNTLSNSYPWGGNDQLGGSASNGSWFNYCIANTLLLSPAYTEQRRFADVITDLMAMTNSAIFFSEGVFKIVPYSDATITANGHTYDPTINLIDQYDFVDDDYLTVVECTRKPQSDAYNSVQVEYVDRNNDYNNAIAEAKDQSAIDKYGLRVAPIMKYHAVCIPQTARNIAQALLQRGLYIRNTYKFTVSARHLLLEPMDVITITDSKLGLNQLKCRVIETEEQENYSIIITAEEFPAAVSSVNLYSLQTIAGYITNYAVAPGNVNTPIIFEPPSAIIKSSYGTNLAFNQFAGIGGGEIWAALSGGVNWGGCDVWASWDGVTYQRVGTFKSISRMGVLTANLAYAADPDNTDTLSVDLTQSRAQLLSGTQADEDAFRTLCIVDGELISYRIATLTATYKYNLTYLRRGVYGTSISAHNTNAPFARLDDAIFKYPYDQSRIGSTVYLKFLSFNVYGESTQALADVSSYTYTIGGNNMAFAVPINFTGDGTTRQFNISPAFKPGSLFVFVNGVFQEINVDYTEDVNRLFITFTTAPANGYKIECRYVKDYSSGNVQFMFDKFVGNGSTLKYTTTGNFRANSLIVFLNGVLQQKGVDYTEDTNGLYFTFAIAPTNGYKIEARYVNQASSDTFFITQFTGDGSTTVFNTSVMFRINSLMIFLNGIEQQITAEYTEDTNRLYFTFVTAPPNNYKVEARYVKN